MGSRVINVDNQDAVIMVAGNGGFISVEPMRDEPTLAHAKKQFRLTGGTSTPKPTRRWRGDPLVVSSAWDLIVTS